MRAKRTFMHLLLLGVLAFPIGHSDLSVKKSSFLCPYASGCLVKDTKLFLAGKLLVFLGRWRNINMKKFRTFEIIFTHASQMLPVFSCHIQGSRWPQALTLMGNWKVRYRQLLLYIRFDLRNSIMSSKCQLWVKWMLMRKNSIISIVQILLLTYSVTIISILRISPTENEILFFRDLSKRHIRIPT